MALDVTRLVGAVRRELSSCEKDGAPGRVLVATRSYPTSMEDLWDALTDPERLKRWFLPVSGDLRLGGSYQFEGNAGGEITECDPPQRLELTWGMGDQVSWMTVTLADDPAGGTSLRLEHVAHVDDEFWDQYGAGATGVGWDQALLGLDQHFAAEPSVVPEIAEAWVVSDEGRSFVSQSSDAWCEVSIGAGTEPAAARAAADRTTAFYTGEPVD